MSHKRRQAYLFLIIAELIWGSLLVIAKPALHIISAQQLIFLRYLVTLPIALPILVFSLRHHRLPKKLFPTLIARELIGGFNLWLLYYALNFVSSLQASLIITVRPIFITLAGLFFLKENEQKNELAGLILATIGATFVTLSPLLSATGFDFHAPGAILIVFTNCLDALLMVQLKKNLQSIPKIAFNSFHVSFSCLIFGLIISPQLPQTINLFFTNHLVFKIALFTGIVGSLIASTLTIVGYTRIEISEATLFGYLKPLAYIPLAVFWLHESINYPQLIGLGIIITGIYLAQKRYRRTARHQLLHHAHDLHLHSYPYRH